MAYYRVNKNKQSNGDNEVHKAGCTYYSDLRNYEALGDHDSCASAVADAKSRGYQADGCAVCSSACHTS